MDKVHGLLRSLFTFILLINFQHSQGDCYRQCFYISKHNQNTNQPPRWLRKHKQVVKVIWQCCIAVAHVSSIVFARLRQCALRRGHIGTAWRIRLNLCFLRSTRVHKPQPKRQFDQFSTAHGRMSGMSFPLIIVPSHTGSVPHLIHASLSPPKSITQTVQPFLHRWP